MKTIISCMLISEAIGYSSLCFSSAWLEVSGKSAQGLWIVVVIWSFCFGLTAEKINKLLKEKQ